jgi:hypothetical protein
MKIMAKSNAHQMFYWYQFTYIKSSELPKKEQMITHKNKLKKIKNKTK